MDEVILKETQQCVLEDYMRKSVDSWEGMCVGGCPPSYILHTHVLMSYLSGGYLSCIKYYNVLYFSN